MKEIKLRKYLSKEKEINKKLFNKEISKGIIFKCLDLEYEVFHYLEEFSKEENDFDCYEVDLEDLKEINNGQLLIDLTKLIKEATN